MKKANINLILSMLIVIALLAVAVFLLFLGEKIDSGVLNPTGDSIQSTLKNGPVDDVEGYGVIVQGMGYGFSLLGYILFVILAVLSGGYALLMLLFLIIARIIYSNEHLLAYRILMGIVYALQIGLEVLILTTLVTEFATVWFVIELLLVGITVFCVINTYSPRIIDKEYEVK